MKNDEFEKKQYRRTHQDVINSKNWLMSKLDVLISKNVSLEGTDITYEEFTTRLAECLLSSGSEKCILLYKEHRIPFENILKFGDLLCSLSKDIVDIFNIYTDEVYIVVPISVLWDNLRQHILKYFAIAHKEAFRSSKEMFAEEHDEGARAYQSTKYVPSTED